MTGIASPAKDRSDVPLKTSVTRGCQRQRNESGKCNPEAHPYTTISTAYSESDAQGKPNIASGAFGIGASGRRAGHGHEVPWRTDRPVRIQTQVGYVRAGVGEMRRVRQIERLSANL